MRATIQPAIKSQHKAARQAAQIDMMAPPVEADVQAFMAESVSLDTRANAHGNQQIDRVLLEDTRPHTVNDVITAAVLDDHRNRCH